jgi:very-short-patch-repair endonuclease
VGAGSMAKTSQTMTRRSRSLRHEMTDAERHLWRRLRQRELLGWRFRRQHPIAGYVADFACIEAKLVIEVDGGQHSGSEADVRRDRPIRDQGWSVLRFWNNDVMANVDGVVAAIAAALGPHPNPPPH